MVDFLGTVLSVCRDLVGDCHGRGPLACVVATEALANCCPTGADQLNRGKRNFGNVWIVFAIMQQVYAWSEARCPWCCVVVKWIGVAT